MGRKDDATALFAAESGIIYMYAITDSVVEGNDQKSGMIKPRGGLADMLGFLFHCSLLIARSANDDLPAAEWLSRFARLVVCLRQNGYFRYAENEGKFPRFARKFSIN